MLEAAATQGIPSKVFKKFVDDQVYMPVRDQAPKTVPSPTHPIVAQQDTDTHRIVTDLLDHAFQLMCAIEDCDFRSLPEKERNGIFAKLGQVRNRIDGLFMTYED